MLDEAGSLDVVRMRHHEFFVLRGGECLFAELARTQRAVDQRHRHRLALALAEGEAIAAGEARRLRRGALELIDHLTLGELDRAERHGEADVFRGEFNLDLTEANLASEGMVAAEARRGGKPHAHRKTFSPPPGIFRR